MSIPKLEHWLTTSQGAYLMAREGEHIERMVANVFGFNAVQLSMGRHDLLASSRIPLRLHAGRGEEVQLKADYRQLPFASQSVDLMLLPHILEFNVDPHQILREVERVLIAEGQVIISGFNPWSLWGLRRLFPGGDDCPWCGRFISLRRLRDWLALLGFEIVAGQFCGYVPPLQQEKWLNRYAFMELAGNRWWPAAGGVYIIQAIKRVHGMRLITPRWQEAARTQKALSPVAQKTTQKESLGG
ncbi:MAG: class I SAM-dependent methyltransferase [Sulfuricellaceae bacterium]|nr:class I SAM-dependent methyltransferase [Sulfuricellaceae bacterium]